MTGRKPPEKAAMVLDRWIEREHLEKGFLERRLHLKWPEIVGPRVAEKTRPIWTDEGILRIVVANSAWLNELNFVKEQMVEQINAWLRKTHTGSDQPTQIRRITFKVGLLSPLDSDHSLKNSGVQSPPLNKADLPAEIVAEIEHEVSALKDPTLREAARNARLAQLHYRHNTRHKRR